MNRLVILGSLVLLSTITFCQIPSILYHQKIDSLLLRLKVTKGTEKVDVLNGLSLYLAPRYFDSSLNYAGEALQMAKKLNYKKGIGIATFNTGNSYYFRMDVKNALTKYFDALRLMEDLEPSEELGNLFCQVAIFTNSAINYRKALLIFRIIKNKTSENYVLPKVAGSLGGDSAYIMSKQNLQYFRKINDWKGVYQTLFDLSNSLFYMRKPEGLAYAEEALKIAESKKDSWRMANAYHKVVNYYENVFNAPEYKTDYKRAEYYLFEALKEMNKSNKIYQYQLIAETYRELGHMHLIQKEFKTAYKYLQKGVSANIIFLKSFDTLVFDEPYLKRFYWGMGHGNMGITYGELKQLFLKTGNFKKAYEYRILCDSMFYLENLNLPLQQIPILQANYEDEKSRQQIALLTKENELRKLKMNHSRILFASIGGLMLVAFLIIMLWIQRKRFGSERKALALEQKLLRAQMNPHFIFNALYSIQNFIVTEKPDKASIYLSKFARLVRNILDNSTEEFVALEKEISTIENYLELQKVRYAGKFEYSIGIADEIDTDIMMIPPMLAQPFIENAIEHGIKHRETPGHIAVRFSLKDHTIIFEVEDDGVGRQKALELEIVQEPGHRSMATSLTRERLKNLNRKLNKKIFLDILDLKNALGEAAGTRVTFWIPL
jgi:hypothetical protein